MPFHNLSIEERWKVMEKHNPDSRTAIENLLDATTKKHDQLYMKRVENFVGTVKILLISTQKRRFMQQETVIYQATLVAAISRGCKLLTEAGGVTARVVDQRVQRAPVFIFDCLENALKFHDWTLTKTDEFKTLAETSTKHGKLLNIKPFLEGNMVHLNFEFFTAEASGQNMVTFATEKEKLPPGLTYAALEGGHSADKRSTTEILNSTRGRKVIAEVTIPKGVMESVFRTTTEALVRQRQIFASCYGQIGSTFGNVANVITGMYIACGQDPASVVESCIGISRFELTKQGDLYCALTLPGVLVASIGGGTILPSQSSCLSILGIKTANELAEVVCAACLAGELSITASFCTDEFAKGHRILARSAKL